ncbi:DNA primase [Candidatus Falkowbacteria bacterium]|nr:DNA primase [Candidatus Falkowbacteria bacterium]
MFSPTEEIKSKLDIVELLQEYIKLQQAGQNWKARCPFHNEKTPSFMVSRDKQIWHCFGCGEGGDVFTFVQKIEGVDFPEALKLLAHKAGVVLERQDPAVTSQRNTLVDINELAAKYYHKVLLESSAATAARDYLAARGADQLTIDSWQLGYAPDSWEETLNFLKKKGFSEQDIFLAGLAVKKERGVGFYDRFRNRLMFPIHNHHGQVVGFSARSLDADAKEAKYINTPQTAVFNKGHLLFGLEKAKQEIRKNKVAVLVEGNMDVITSHQAGVGNVVASCGTALTIDQVKILKRSSDTMALSFDPDAAGQNAAERGIDVALQQGMNVRVITLPVGQDPDDFIKRHSAEEWRARISAAVPVLQYYFDKSFTGADLTDPQVKKAIAAKLLTVIVKVADAVEQTHWLQQLADKLSVPENILRETVTKLTSIRKSESGVTLTTPSLHASMSRAEKESERFLAILLHRPEFLQYAAEHLLPEMLVGQRPVVLYTDLIIYYNKATDETKADLNGLIKAFFKNLDKEFIDYGNQLSLMIAEESDSLSSDQVKNEVIHIIRDLKHHYLKSQLKQLGEQIKVQEDAGNSAEVKRLSEKFSALTEQLYTIG